MAFAKITKSGSLNVGTVCRIVKEYPDGRIVVQTPLGFRTYKIGLTAEYAEKA